MTNVNNVDNDSSSSSSSLETPQKINFEDAPPPAYATATGNSKNHLESMFVDKGSTLKALALLSLGLKNEDGSLIFNLLVLPWSAAIQPSAIKMTAAELKEEVVRAVLPPEITNILVQISGL
jgi:hypothetical protein